MNIISTKNRSTYRMSEDAHRSYGIQNWLCSKGYCLPDGGKYKVDKSQYEALLWDFVKHKIPDFKPRKGFKIERYIDRNFSEFCQFTNNKFKKS